MMGNIAITVRFLLVLLIPDGSNPPHPYYRIYKEDPYVSQELCEHAQTPEGTDKICIPVPYPVREDPT